MLSAEFAFLSEPVVEDALPSLDEFEPLQGDVLVALGFVVGVETLQRLVEDRCEVFEVVRFAADP